MLDLLLRGSVVGFTTAKFLKWQSDATALLARIEGGEDADEG